MLFYVIVWSIWKLCNDMIFNGKVFDYIQISNTIRFRLATWFKAKWPDCPNSTLDIVKFPKEIQVQKVSKATKKAILWERPPSDFLKFNVDGFARGKPGPTGIGGVLRDYNLTIKGIFSKATKVVDLNVAKLLAVKEALRLYAASRWASSHRLIIESDSSNVMNWMLNPLKVP